MGELSSQVNYKSVHKNPMDKNRVPTDTFCLYIFGAALLAWFIMNCIFLFKGGNAAETTMLDKNFINTSYLQKHVIVALPKMFNQWGTGLIVWTALIGSFSFLFFLKTLHCLPKFWTVVGFFSLALSVGLFIYLIFYYVFSLVTQSDPITLDAGYQIKTTIDIIRFTFAIIIAITGINAARTVKLASLADVVKKASDGIFFFPTLFLFGAAIMILSLLVIIFMVAALYNTSNALFFILNLLGTLYLMNLIYNFGVLVIGQCLSTWYWSESKNELSGALIFKSMGLVARNHMGTAAFSSTFGLPVILSLYVLLSNKFPSPPKSIFTSIVVKFCLIYCITEYALMVTASHGLSIHNAMKKIYSLFTRSCAIVLAFSCVFYCILQIFVGISMFISFAVAIAIFRETSVNNQSEFWAMVFIFYSLAILLFTSVYVTAATAANTILVNTTEEIEENEEREMAHIQSNV